MSIRTREDTRRRVRGEARAGELEAALRRELAGDVRADAYTRHLYAADASMYAVEPLRVAFPRSADDVAAAVAIAARATACRSSRAAAARASRARPRAGAGSCSTTRATCDAIGEIDVADRRVRVEPGVVQEELNARRASRTGSASARTPRRPTGPRSAA